MKMNNALAINGGRKTCESVWPSWPIWDDSERAGVMDVLESGKWWYGERVKQFETEFAAFQDARYAVTASSGTTALETLLEAADIGPGDEVIVPPYTFIATASAVLRVGAIPVFADIEPGTWSMDPEAAVKCITPRTKAIMPVHFGGRIVDMDRFLAIGREHNVIILEDACHSWGGKWQNKGTGAIGRAGVFSFQVSKNIASAEGGIILTDDQALAEQCRSITNCGRTLDGAWYDHANLGSNLRLTEFQAAILLGQLSRLESHTLQRERNGAYLTERLAEMPAIDTLTEDSRITRRPYHLYTFRLNSGLLGVSRERFIKALEAEGVPASPGYLRPAYKMGVFQNINDPGVGGRVMRANPGIALDYSKVHCPVAERACMETVWLSHTLLLADADAMRGIADAIEKVLAHAAEIPA
jgi:dTDP-4-amino-4,6-dideoxygalactose transaminase